MKPLLVTNRKMKVFLLNAPPLEKGVFVKEGRCQARSGAELWPPVTLGIVAAQLKNHGYDIKVMDAPALNIGLKGIKDFVKKNRFDAVVFNSTTVTFFDDLQSARVIKEVDPGIINIFYGTHATARPDDVLAEDAIDFAVRNEPEIITLSLLDAIRDKKDLRSIKGVSFKDDGKIINNEKAEFIKNLDELPYPGLEFFPIEKYRLPHNGRKWTVIRTSRGCPSKCSYCTARLYYGNRWRFRSPKHVLDEIERDVKQFGITHFLFNSDTFNLNKVWVKEVCDGIKERGLEISWMCNSRVDTIDEKTLRMMKDAGCWLVSFGFESGSQKILDNVEKGATIEQAEQAMKIVKSVGLKSIGYFILGLPGESEETIRETIRFAHKLNPTYARFFKAVPYPGTEFGELAEESGWMKNGHAWNRYDQADCDVYELETISSKEINGWLRKAYLGYYLRPGYVLSQFKENSVRDFFYSAKSGVNFLKVWLKRE
jgi:anaerobic magnesium-protoporphyrin IX monomethyl ester cyclase